MTGDTLMTAQRRVGSWRMPRWSCRALIEFTKLQLCGACHAGGVSDTHHSIHRSRGNLASDLFLAPLCHLCHMEYRSMGREPFEAKHRINIGALIVENLEKFIDSILK